MKTFLSVALFALICLYGSIVQAVTHSTQENFNHCFKMCISAINETADYIEVLKKGNDEVISMRQQDCSSLAESLGFLSNYTAEGAESKICILETRTILLARSLTLGYYLDAMNAYRARNIGLFEEYKRRMAKSSREAEQFRQEFLNKYGY